MNKQINQTSWLFLPDFHKAMPFQIALQNTIIQNQIPSKLIIANDPIFVKTIKEMVKRGLKILLWEGF